MGMLDDVFEVLETATRLEATGVNRIEAATKYYEAIYLMKQYIQSTPHTTEEAPKRRLLQEKIKQYETVAARLLADDQSTAQSIANNPRSPISGQSFFNQGSNVVPLPPPAPQSESSSLSSRLTQSEVLSQRASEANTKLCVAIDLDEQDQTTLAIEAYLAAAEIYLEAIKLAEASNQDQQSAFIGPVLVRRLEGVFDRVQQLKEPKVTKNRQVLHNQDKPKSTTINPKTTTSTTATATTTPDTSLTQTEILVLKRSSMIASGLFLPWSDDDAQQLSARVQKMTAAPTTLFTDPDGELCLSNEQRKHFFRYAGAADIVQQRKRRGVIQHAPVLIKTVSPYSIRQRCVTDCSFIASLCICAAFERRFRKRLITSIVYPQDANGIPIYNPEGKYMVKLWLNGVGRQVIVDDRLPVDRHSNLLCSHTMGATNQLELWVSIIEKAYMKLCGGYDFPGSNSGVDLFSLTGWIPERIFFAPTGDGIQKLKDFETPPLRAWERLFSANSFGDCLITVSTTKDMSEEQAEALGLVTGHAYAVLDVIQTKNGTKLLLLKNPWATTGWKGKFSRDDRESWRDPKFCTEVGYIPDLVPEEDDGVFWIQWDDVLRYFRNLQLSWNPTLFTYRVTIHDFWPKDRGPTNDTFNVGENPQYIMTLSKEAISKKATIWVMISRHVEKQEQAGCEVTDFLTIHLLRNSSKKERLFYPHGKRSLVNGAYSNNPHVLVRYDATGPSDEFISLVLSQYKKSHDMGYTLSCFCTEPFSLGPPQKELAHVQELTSEWTSLSSGGPVGRDDFFRNPMWFVNIPSDSILQLRCSTAKTFAVNVMLLEMRQHDISSGNYRQLAKGSGKPRLDSGNYRFGFAVTERERIPAGTYALIVSTFDEGQLGVFNVKVCSSVKLKIGPVP